MGNKFKSGDKVICISNGKTFHHSLKLNSVYTVDLYADTRITQHEKCFYLKEFPADSSGYHKAYTEDRFKHANLEIFDELGD